MTTEALDISCSDGTQANPKDSPLKACPKDSNDNGVSSTETIPNNSPNDVEEDDDEISIIEEVSMVADETPVEEKSEAEDKVWIEDAEDVKEGEIVEELEDKVTGEEPDEMVSLK